MDPKPASSRTPQFQENPAVYGPISSKKFGAVIVADPFAGACLSGRQESTQSQFECFYCRYRLLARPSAKRRPAPIKTINVLLEEAEKAFDQFARSGAGVDQIIISGATEPTLYPDFLEWASGLVRLRNRYFPKVKTAIFSDGFQTVRPEIREAFVMLDRKFIRVDAGHRQWHADHSQPVEMFDEALTSIRALRDVVVLSLFVRGAHENAHPEWMDDWNEMVGFLQPKEACVFTLGHELAQGGWMPDPGILPLPELRLKEIAEHCRAMTGVFADLL